MRALHGGRSFETQMEYHLADGRAPEFDQGQPGRVDLARFLIEKILVKDLRRRPLRIVELGCGAGDVSGPYSRGVIYNGPRGSVDTSGIEIVGVDIVPMAREKCAERWPDMQFILAPVETLTPIDCDILVMTEFLEHLADPISVVRTWMPQAEWAIIGHPLNEPDPPYEGGHAWSYTMDDFVGWFAFGPMRLWEHFRFPMGYYTEMIMGHGSKA